MKTITIELDSDDAIQKIKTLSHWFDIEKYLLSQTHKEFLYNFSILVNVYKEKFCKLTDIDLKSISENTLTIIFYLLSNPKEQTKYLSNNFLFSYVDATQPTKIHTTKIPIYITSRNCINNAYVTKPYCTLEQFNNLCEEYKQSIVFCDGGFQDTTQFITMLQAIRVNNIEKFKQENNITEYKERQLTTHEIFLKNRNDKLSIYKIENYVTEDLVLYGYLQCLTEIDVYADLCADGITITYIIPEHMKHLIKEYSLQECHTLNMPSGIYYLCDN
mgnify:CR=1 FL=1